jgi:hypothetical protein
MLYYNYFRKIVRYLNHISQKSIVIIAIAPVNQGPNTITAGAAIAVLTAQHPILAYTQPLTDTRDPGRSSEQCVMLPLARHQQYFKC